MIVDTKLVMHRMPVVTHSEESASDELNDILNDVLDTSHALLERSDIVAGMSYLDAGLRDIQLQTDAQTWAGLVQSTCLTHPLRNMVHQDPFTWRAFSKPRGYAGDAVMLDYIYYTDQCLPLDVSELGQQIFRYATNCAAPRAVRHRRTVLAELIDACAVANRHPKILSIAAGHLREAELSEALRSGSIAEFVALDQDDQSLAVVGDAYGHLGVRAFNATVRDLLRAVRRGVPFGDMDLVYAAGLFDYLPQTMAQHLALAMWLMLKPGGRMLIPNFLPEIADSGYMTSFMAWHLIYRTPPVLMDVIKKIPAHDVSRTQLFNDPDQNILYMLVEKQR